MTNYYIALLYTFSKTRKMKKVENAKIGPCHSPLSLIHISSISRRQKYHY